MFTGIITATGRVSGVEDVEGLRRLWIELVHEAGSLT